MHVIMHGCMVIVLAVHTHIHIYIYMIYDKTRILLNHFVGLLLGCKSSYTVDTHSDSQEQDQSRLRVPVDEISLINFLENLNLLMF